MGVAQMRNNDAAADNQSHIKGILQFSIGAAGLDALTEIIISAVMSAEARSYLGLSKR
jgi:hypothetical protein